MLSRLIFACAIVCALSGSAVCQKWPEAKAPAVPQADPYVAIPGAALSPGPNSAYSAVFDATKFPSDPKSIVPALNAAGGLLNDIEVGGAPMKNTHFVVVFHGSATNGILDNEHYRAKYGIDNPNLAVLAKMRKMGTEFYVCGQYLASANIDPAVLSKDVKVAADAYLVLIGYQNKNYGVMFF